MLVLVKHLLLNIGETLILKQLLQVFIYQNEMFRTLDFGIIFLFTAPQNLSIIFV